MAETELPAENPITTLSAFLEHSGAKYQVFDMGRRVAKLSNEGFDQFERGHQPYPYPLQRHAIFGVIFWDPQQPDNRYVWFLKLPLDEQGLLIPQARDAFLVMLLERVGESMLAATDGQKIDGALKDSPYTFTPREEKMAAFNALATYHLTLPPSPYFDTAYQYFTGQTDADHWQNLAMQGVADVAVRLNGPDELQGLIQSLPNLPDVPFQTLCNFLECAQPAINLLEQLSQLLATELQKQEPNSANVMACLRAASNSPAQGLLAGMVEQTLKHDCSRDIDILAVIGGRCWTVLKQLHLANLYCEQLALNNAGQPGFSQLLADLLYMPELREPVMQALRSKERSNALAIAVGEMFGK
ncbi:MAG TPA: DUF3549 family protein [Methylophaga sp.]|nr:DUF3549 family protein [Methylophaga sp.]